MRKENTQASPCLPTEKMSQQEKMERMLGREDAEESCLKSKGSQVFTDLQSNPCLRLFHDLLHNNNRIERKALMERVMRDDEAKKELSAFTPQQLADKVRAERNKAKKSK